ncbi:hypothetical protein C7447_1011021 [Tenacibaculum adriaticum]|uniref:S-adenosyl-methyltransferase n=1 Tax=Tenacibaculum adriaticum TaxID=413713 RepID=A0A5S5DWU3_9FLAO|nr:FtsL-like putative cell division protein [Tenacibaculum adriaticum]TYQ00408.1 hypothetical protein C7447_1011021 [Tenacibaculum adriaticum]
MTTKTSGIYDLLRGSFLTDESSVKNWRIIMFVVGLLLIMIWSAHSADAKVVRIAELNKEKRELRAEYIDTSTILMRMKLESSVRKKANEIGLAPAKTPPQKIKVTKKR